MNLSTPHLLAVQRAQQADSIQGVPRPPYGLGSSILRCITRTENVRRAKSPEGRMLQVGEPGSASERVSPHRPPLLGDTCCLKRGRCARRTIWECVSVPLDGFRKGILKEGRKHLVQHQAVLPLPSSLPTSCYCCDKRRSRHRAHRDRCTSSFPACY